MLLYYNGKLLRYLRYYGLVTYEVHSFTINLEALHFIHYNTKAGSHILHCSGKLRRYLQYYGSVMYEVHSFTINLEALHFTHSYTKAEYCRIIFSCH